METNMRERFKAICIGVNYPKIPYDIETSLSELSALAAACNIEVIDTIIQNLDHINNVTYIGSGKILDLKAVANGLAANLIIVNDELSPSQLTNLQEQLEIEVIDRTYLILDIFASRAKTKEAMLQVDIARLRYMLPRLIGMSEAIYSQQGGSGFRGSGETKLELDRRKIKKEIAAKERELAEVVKQRANSRRKRQKNDIPVISLVGYTNSGKSSLLNRLLSEYNKAEKQVFALDMLFATLETATRMIELADKKQVLLTDTVGFVDQLPHHLVKAFQSTLEEVREADLLIHVVDSANPNYQQQIKVTNKVLEKIGVKDIPVLYVYNKMDICENVIVQDQEQAIYMSVLKDESIDTLINAIKKIVFKDYSVVNMLIPYSAGSKYAYLKEKANIIKEEQVAEGYKLLVEISNRDKGKFELYIN